jgi:hypothetical protein
MGSEKDEFAMEYVVCQCLPFSLANHNSVIIPYPSLLRCTMALERQHIIKLSVFNFGTSCIMKHLVGQEVGKFYK